MNARLAATPEVTDDYGANPEDTDTYRSLRLAPGADSGALLGLDAGQVQGFSLLATAGEGTDHFMIWGDKSSLSEQYCSGNNWNSFIREGDV